MAKKAKLDKKLYEAEMTRLQTELVEMQEWVKATGARLVVIFEGRDAAGKGGAIKRITEYLNPRVARIVALPSPTERQKSQWYFQRYIEHLPAAGEIRLFDRSWYNRGGVEKVMGYCTPEEHVRWLRQVPTFERMLIDDGIMLRKYWFSVSDHEQEKRFRSRMTDPMRRWKLSPTDLESLTRWEDYSRAKDEMFVHTDVPGNRWNVVEAEDKKRARINMIAHLLDSVPYEHVSRPPIEFPERPESTGYRRTARSLQNEVPDHASELVKNGIGHKYIDPEDEDEPKKKKKKKKDKQHADAEAHDPQAAEAAAPAPASGPESATGETAADQEQPPQDAPGADTTAAEAPVSEAPAAEASKPATRRRTTASTTRSRTSTRRPRAASTKADEPQPDADQPS